MKEYTVLACLSVFVTLILDRGLGVNVMKKRGFWLYLLLIACFKLLVNGYLTAQTIVVYDPRFFLGRRIGTIPLEDFLFGFSMVTMSIIFWEYYKLEDHSRPRFFGKAPPPFKKNLSRRRAART